jgi:Primase C terminal 2 (PriCT-2)
MSTNTTHDHKSPYENAAGYLGLLAPDETLFTFFAAPDNKDGRPVWQTTATLAHAWPEIERRNRDGYGVFVAVNQFAGRRRASDLRGIRAIWQEDDDGFKGTFPYPPHFEVSSSPGKTHRYWLAKDITEEQHAGLMAVMVRDYGSDKAAADLCRVLRLPGTLHQKDNAAPRMVRVSAISDLAMLEGPHTGAELIGMFGPIPDAAASAERPLADIGADETAHIAKALQPVASDEYLQWLTVGMALHNKYGGADEGLELWDKWSASASNYEPDVCAIKWDTFDANAVGGATIGTVYALSKQAGGSGMAYVEPYNGADFPPVPAELLPEAKPTRLLEFPSDISPEVYRERERNALVKDTLFP